MGASESGVDATSTPTGGGPHNSRRRDRTERRTEAAHFEAQLAVLADMQREGKINHVGLPKVTVSQIRRARELIAVAAVQNKYSVGNRAYKDVLQYCTQHDIPFIPYAPLATGQLLRADGRLARLSKSRGLTPAQLALAWLLNASPVMMPHSPNKQRRAPR